MFDKIVQQVAEKLLPVILEGQKLHRKAMLVKATSCLMASGHYPMNEPIKAFEIAKIILKLAEVE